MLAAMPSSIDRETCASASTSSTMRESCCALPLPDSSERPQYLAVHQQRDRAGLGGRVQRQHAHQRRPARRAPAAARCAQPIGQKCRAAAPSVTTGLGGMDSKNTRP